MKLTLLLMATVAVVTAQESFLRGDLSNEVFLVGEPQLLGSPIEEATEERRLGEGLDEDDFKTLYVKYRSKEKKCVLTYKVKGEDHEEEIDFGKMEESDDGLSVTCKKSGLDKTAGIVLPVEAYGFDASWKEPDGDKITDFKKTKFKWGKDKTAYVYLERKKGDPPPDDGPMDESDFSKLYVKYRSKEKKCVLTYKVKGEDDEETIDFGDIDESDDGRSVTCKKSGVGKTDGIHLPVEAEGFDALWKEPDGDKVTEFKKTKFKWSKDKKAYVYLERKKKDPPPDDDGMDQDDFKKIIAKYWSKEKKCTLTYRVKGEDRETINFGDIDESSDGRKVTCKKRAKPTEGIHLPVYADEFDAIWRDPDGDSTTEFEETKWKWEKNKYAVLTLERKKAAKDPMDENDFKCLVATYKSKEKKCSLTYKVHGKDKEKIWFNNMDESDNGRRVVCRGNVSPTDGVWLPVKADGFDAVWKEKGGSSIEVEESMLRWKKNKDITLTLKREPNGMDGDDFDSKIVYDASKPHHKKCKLIYEVNGKGKKTVWLNDYVKERNGGTMVVCKEYDAKPTSGIDLPIKANDVKAQWFNEDGVKQDVENAKLVWDEGRDIKATIYLDH